MPNNIIHLLCKDADPLLYTSLDLCELLSQFIHDLERQYSADRFDLLPGAIDKKVNPKLQTAVIRAVQLIDKTIVDGRNGVASLSQGKTNLFLVTNLPVFKAMAYDLSKDISQGIQKVKREIAFMISPVVNSLDRFATIDDAVINNLSELVNNSVPKLREVKNLLPDNELVDYNFDHTSVGGTITIQNYGTLVLKGRRAAVFYALYKNRYKDESYDYQDVNRHLNDLSGVKEIGYDTIRVDVNSINKRIKKLTKGKIEKIISNESLKTKNKTLKNKYRYQVN